MVGCVKCNVHVCIYIVPAYLCQHMYICIVCAILRIGAIVAILKLVRATLD